MANVKAKTFMICLVILAVKSLADPFALLILVRTSFRVRKRLTNLNIAPWKQLLSVYSFPDNLVLVPLEADVYEYY